MFVESLFYFRIIQKMEYPKSNLNRVKRGANRATYDVDQINDILKAGFVGFVGYIYEGRAISIPMAYGYEEGVIYLHGSTGNRMLKSLLDMEEISMTVMHLDGLVLARSGFNHSVNYRSATLFGKAVKVEDDNEKIRILENITNQMVPNRWDSLRETNQQELDRTLVISMKIESASAKIRGEGVIDEKEDEGLPIWAGIVPIRQIAEAPVSDPLLPDEVSIPDHVVDYYEKNKY